MTTLDEPSCLMNFKVGKYLTNGDEYRLFMQKLLFVEEIETIKSDEDLVEKNKLLLSVFNFEHMARAKQSKKKISDD